MGQAHTGRAVVVGVFTDPPHAELAVDELARAGIGAEQISVVGRSSVEPRTVIERPAGGDTSGNANVATGAVAGGLLGGLLALGSLALPGIGPIFAGGAIAAALSGATLGAITGGLVGALTDAGIPPTEAERYDLRVREGRVIVTVAARSEGEASTSRSVFERRGAAEVQSYGAGAQGLKRTAQR